jgi:transcription initiation factor IIE alpha subunit
MAENDHQAAARKVVRIVRGRGEMLHGDLVRAMQHTMRARDLKDLIGALVEAGEIASREARPPHGGVTARYYRAG